VVGLRKRLAWNPFDEIHDEIAGSGARIEYHKISGLRSAFTLLITTSAGFTKLFV
jgi:hypothetical protein